MAMTIHQLKIFWAVAQAKSYTKASKMLEADLILGPFQDTKVPFGS